MPSAPLLLPRSPIRSPLYCGPCASAACASIRCLSIVRLSPTRRTFVIQPANGIEGYLPTQQHRQLEGYGNWLDTIPLEL